MRIEFQPAYVLHARAYRDTSLIIDFLTPEYGRIAAMARGARQRKGGRRPLLNPFIPLLISVQGRTDLKLLTGVEAAGPVLPLIGPALYSGLYLNELLVRLLLEAEPHPALYADYQHSLQALVSADLEPVLRSFEFSLLEQLGYGLNFETEAYTDRPLQAQREYVYQLQAGFVPASTPGGYRGQQLQAIALRDFSDPLTRQVAKHLARQVLAPLLGHRPLNSRALFKPG